MALPLPRVVPDVGPGGGIVTAARGVNALEESQLNNEIKRAQAKYAPQQAYADAASKIAYANMLPYQIQATVMSNPLLWQALKDNPNAMGTMLQDFAKNVPQGKNILGGMQMPPPNSGGFGSGLLGMFLNKIMGNGAQQQQPMNPMQQQPQQPPSSNPFAQNGMMGTPPSPMGQGQGADSGYSFDAQGNNVQATPQEVQQKAQGLPLLPASQGGTQAVASKMTAPYDVSPYDQGKLVNTPQGATSVPTSQNVTSIQNSYNSIKNVLPVLDEIAKEGKDLLQPGVLGKEKLSQISNLIKQYAPFNVVPEPILRMLGVDKNLVSRVANWEAKRATALEGLMGALNLPQNEHATRQVAKIIDARAGESGNSYFDRINNEVNYLKNTRLPQYQKILGEGVKLGNEKSKSLIPEGMNEDQFNNWYLSLPSETRQKVKNEIRGKE